MAYRNSMPGYYEGFSEKKYPKSVKQSLYVPGYDGTKLACDIMRPVLEDGSYPEEKLPVIMLLSRGQRMNTERKHNGVDIIEYCVPYGYVGVVLESRGCGASYGTCDSFADIEDRHDVNAVLDWLGEQPWCSGKAALFGGSNRGLIQFAAAVNRPEPSKVLKAITPVVANADFYYQDYVNGVSALPGSKRHGHMFNKKPQGPMSKEDFLKKVTPVDDDPDGDQAYEAYLSGQYGKNHGFMNYLVLPNMCRDSENPNFGGEKTNLTLPPYEDLEVFRNSDIKIHQFAGEIESGFFGQLNAVKEWGGSILAGPWDHHQSRTGTDAYPEGRFDFKAEHLKWFDYVLKDTANGFDEKPPYMYYTLNAKEGENWRCSDTWPLETERRVKLYLSPETSGTVDSVHDGSLVQNIPEAAETEYKVDTSIEVFDEGEGATIDRMHLQWDGDMTPGVDRKGLTFTSQPLFDIHGAELTGVTSVDLWVSCSQKDADFIAYLEEVDAEGKSTYISQGVIRASHRTSAPRQAWDESGAVYHPCMKEDMDRCLEEGMDEPVHLQFHIEPVSWTFRRRSRVRITITCADSTCYQHYMYDENDLPVIRLYQGGDHASFVSMPFVEHTENTYNGSVEWNGVSGPGTLYFFKNNTYLYFDGIWRKFPSDQLTWKIEDGAAVFSAGFRFIHEGTPVCDGILQHYEGKQKAIAPFPAFRRQIVAEVPVGNIPGALYVPDVKTLYVDVFKNGKNSEAEPAIVFIHGYSGTPGKLRPQQADLISRGYTLIGVDLRSYPGNYFPDYLYDLKGNVRYIRANAERFGVIPDRIASYGQSLGGNSALLLGITGGERELEGDVGGNLEYSSRVQAMVVGYGWSDCLYMGKDLADEYKDAPEEVRLQKERNSDGPNAPLGHVIGFTGKGKGIKVLREYLESGREGTDPYLDEMLEKARFASPVNHIGPDAAPAMLYGGLGMTRVDIPYNQNFRTFEKCAKYGVECFMISNTNGSYGSKPVSAHAIADFLDEVLVRHAFPKKTAAVPGERTIVEDSVDVKLDYAPVIAEEDGLKISCRYLKERYGIETETDRKYIRVEETSGMPFSFTYYADKNMAVFDDPGLRMQRVTVDRTH